jgi:hypothetical protein
MKIFKWKAFTNTSSLACSTIECLQRMHNSIVTAFNGNTNYTKPNNEVPPKDAQLQGGPNQISTHNLNQKVKCLKKASKGKGRNLKSLS